MTSRIKSDIKGNIYVLPQIKRNRSTVKLYTPDGHHWGSVTVEFHDQDGEDGITRSQLVYTLEAAKAAILGINEI